MPATLAQIAKKVGVSRQAVSYALNNREGQVSENTRERILKVARELAYRPNSSARATRTGRMGCIDLLASTSPAHSRLPGSLINALHDRLAERESRLAIFRLSDDRMSDDREMHSAFRNRSSDGLLVNYTHGAPEGVSDLLLQFRIPAVWLHAKLPHDCVYTAAGETYEKITQRLIAMGHRRIAYLAFHRDGHFSEDDRALGYTRAMRSAGLTPLEPEFDLQSNQFYRDNPEKDDRLARVREWLTLPDRPTAVVSYGGTESMVTMFAANGLGLSIPGDLSLVSLNDEGVIPVCIPLTACVIPHSEVAEAAVDMLIKKIDSPAEKISPCAIPLKICRDSASIAPPR